MRCRLSFGSVEPAETECGLAYLKAKMKVRRLVLPGEGPGAPARDRGRRFDDFSMERATGFEPATSTLARLHSTTELFPPRQPKNITKRRRNVQKEMPSFRLILIDDRIGNHGKNLLLFRLIFVHYGKAFGELKFLVK